MSQAQQAGQSNREQHGRIKNNRFAHTANTKYGMGDNYGTGIKQKVGRMREDQLGFQPMTPKKLGTPPKSVV